MKQRPLQLALFVFACVGLVVFASGIAIEFMSTRRIPLGDSLSPAVQVALGGLCVAALMFVLWVALVGLSLVRQSRELGSGYGDAYRLMESFRFKDAIPLLERSIQEGKESPNVLMLLTSAYAYTGQLGKAQTIADRAVNLFPDDPGSYITLANGYRLQAAYDEAARGLRQAAELAGDEPVVWAELGFVQRLAGQHDEAVESFRRAAQHTMPPMYEVRVYYYVAEAHERVGEFKEAASARVKMFNARTGLEVWKAGLKALEGTAYGQALRHEIALIEQALAMATQPG